jgi:hypothetical protein
MAAIQSAMANGMLLPAPATRTVAVFLFAHISNLTS